LEPHIIHVVAYCEAMKRATSKEIIESVKMVRRAYTLAVKGLPDFLSDPEIKSRVEELLEEAMVIIDAIRKLGKGREDPLLDPETLYKAVETGILDAPGLLGFSVAKGKIKVSTINGAVYAVNEEGKILKERERLADGS
ncbi:MAG: methionine synthase, partial [Thermotogae bacterium]